MARDRWNVAEGPGLGRGDGPRKYTQRGDLNEVPDGVSPEVSQTT